MVNTENGQKKPRVRFQIFHYYLIPLVALVVWFGLLISLLICWGIQGRPIYSFMTTKQNPVYLSDLGATNLQPLFISCSGFQAIFFVGTLVVGYYLRKKHKIQPYISHHQPRLAIASIICAIIGQLGILFVSIFNTKNFHSVHLSMVGIFIAFVFLACCCDFGVSYIFGSRGAKLDPIHNGTIFGKSRFANLYFVSFVAKIIWLIVAIVLAACFGYYMKHGNDSLSARFEWSICFWYGFLLILWSMDLFPSAVRKYRSKHPHLYETNQYDYENQNGGNSQWEKDINNKGRSSSELGDQYTYVNSPMMQNQKLANQQFANEENQTNPNEQMMQEDPALQNQALANQQFTEEPALQNQKLANQHLSVADQQVPPQQQQYEVNYQQQIPPSSQPQYYEPIASTNQNPSLPQQSHVMPDSQPVTYNQDPRVPY
ncbi:hypothetical protein KGF54_001723 [Candida jiufengensis]|uniref:uncharacterized protein n=1 Tax=Candida jiufengensis TaxID=497108 RepID=UPI0022258578|nr:uncharacterized protein KGF54_001723 [Candida jiufengensis]KAI5955162.1 hypothetical protein KGF54_001723 [Candida jiufengensis]